MDAFMDSLWLKIEAGVHFLRGLLDIAFSPLHALGPVVTISVIALVTVLVTKVLTKTIRTRRFAALQKEFIYWRELREEAMKAEDTEKGRRLAKNIDQAKLNRVYYDYFFEGLMLSLATKYLPILAFLAYVNETYRPAAMEKMFGHDVLFYLPFSAEPKPVGPVFWFVLSLAAFYTCWPMAVKAFGKISGRLGELRHSRFKEAVSENRF
jgi:uncharacterized membrane protein (DUF106 family)